MSWYHKPEPLELHTPWWISGYALSEVYGDLIEIPTICAALMATGEDDAGAQVATAYLVPPRGEIEFRFVNERPEGWEPFCDRFQRADWMQWPPAEAKQTGNSGTNTK